MKTLRYILEFTLGIALPLVIQRWDRARLTPAQRDRSWNTASWGAALYAFGPLSMIGWGWVTRRGLGLLLGILATVAIMAMITGAHYIVSMAFGLEP